MAQRLERDARPIFITGYMASGKTTFGHALANATGRTFIDLDFYIEQRFRRPIAEMFRIDGEETFRRREAAMLREAGEFENVVVACGGGTPCFHDNMDYMLGRGLVVFLDTSPEKIAERLVANNARRPLMAGKSADDIRHAIDIGLGERMPHYLMAHIRHSGEHLEDRHEIETAIRNFIDSQKFGNERFFS